MKWLKTIFERKEKPTRGVFKDVLFLILIAGAAMMGLGLLMSIFEPTGISATFGMLGAVLCFLALFIFTLLWFFQEGFK